MEQRGCQIRLQNANLVLMFVSPALVSFELTFYSLVAQLQISFRIFFFNVNTIFRFIIRPSSGVIRQEVSSRATRRIHMTIDEKNGPVININNNNGK